MLLKKWTFCSIVWIWTIISGIKTLKKIKNREKAIFMREFSFLIEFFQFKILFYLNFKRVKVWSEGNNWYYFYNLKQQNSEKWFLKKVNVLFHCMGLNHYFVKRRWKSLKMLRKRNFYAWIFVFNWVFPI